MRSVEGDPERSVLWYANRAVLGRTDETRAHDDARCTPTRSRKHPAKRGLEEAPEAQGTKQMAEISGGRGAEEISLQWYVPGWSACLVAHLEVSIAGASWQKSF